MPDPFSPEQRHSLLITLIVAVAITIVATTAIVTHSLYKQSLIQAGYEETVQPVTSGTMTTWQKRKDAL